MTTIAPGKTVRAEVPRSAHATMPPADRDPVAILEEQARTRVPELVPIRYERMLVSPFAFFRGAAAIMARDLAELPHTRLQAQLCGDAHLSNFGMFAAPDRRLVFSVNDFDETLPGPFEWDLKRLAASFSVACREQGIEAEPINRRVARAYREAIRTFAGMRTLDVWYARADVEELARRWGPTAARKQRKRFERDVAKARGKDSLRAFARLTEVVDGRPRIAADPPLIVPVEEIAGTDDLEEGIRSILRSYRRTLPRDRRRLLERFRYAHAARKVVGVGSVGTRAWIVLLLGAGDHDPLFLQFKEAQASVLEPFLGAGEFRNHGQRVVEGQRLMQSASDILLGWLRVSGFDGEDRDFYIRQLWDQKGSVVIETLDAGAMDAYGRLCGWTLAHAHARSGDATAIAAYLGSSGKFDRALAAFADAYADQNERDYAALRAAVASGRVAQRR